jgi:hypothetical protein
VCPRRAGSFLGYERSTMTEPRPLAALLAWRTRGSFFVLWGDMQLWNAGGVEFRDRAPLVCIAGVAGRAALATGGPE